MLPQVFGLMTQPLVRLLLPHRAKHLSSILSSEPSTPKALSCPLLENGHGSDVEVGGQLIPRPSRLGMLLSKPTHTVHHYWRKFDDAFMRPVFGGRAVCGGDEGLKASFVFGDSLVDAGNNNYLPSLSKADMRPNGIDFAASGGQPTGRLGMDVQLDYFNITRQQLDGLLGKAEAKEFVMKKSIFSVTVGSNDFLNNYLLPVVSAGERATETPDSFIESLIISFRSQLTVVVANVGPIGCIPYQKTINKVKEEECVGLPNQLAVQYNSQLRDMLTELNDNLPGAKFVIANVYDLVMELLTDYRSHGKSSIC
ncbi:hypothetical protein BHM03_00036923 [Ensete ventricosum]|nr:hypothetical protein BHM03_00036923 [Ensete ventricosum]